ncbi:cytochrome P450 [Streptomyces antimycoticus]|uniref:cytochrome P450 n=1 Tax=Streptomyces antimycoticus TaxID=68175 RepID=UPI00344A4C92
MGLYDELRAQYGQMAPVLVPGDLPAWLVLGYRAILEVTRNPSRFSRDSRLWRCFQDGAVPADSPLQPTIGHQPLCVFADGPEHRRLRGAVTQGLNRFDRTGVRRYVTRFANRLVDSFSADGHADLVDRFAERLPMLVMTQLIGMPEEYGPRLVDAARDLMRGTETAIASNTFVVQTLQQLTARKELEPGNDLASWLLQDDRLSNQETLEHLRLVLIAANETTVNLIANTLRLILTDRRFHGNLKGGQMTLVDALEQVLWDNPSISVLPGRWATADTELCGQPIRKGDMLLLGLQAGNVDPEIRPDLFTPVHGNRSHLAFSSGPHACPGQDLGRAIAEAGIDTLLTRLPDLRLTRHEDSLRLSAGWISRHVVELPVTFTPHPTRSRQDRSGGPHRRETSAQKRQGRVTSLTLGHAATGAGRLPWWRRILRSRQ